MKKKTLFILTTFLPFILAAQSDEAMVSDEPEAAVVIESSPESDMMSEAKAMPDVAAVEAPTVVEIPDAPIAGASFDGEDDIPKVTKVLPSSSEVVLDIPGQGAGAGATIMNQEETISVDFPDESVRTILRNVADLFDLNLVIPDTLQGRTSLKLRNITWRQVFEVVLDPLGFTYVEDRNIIRIKSIDSLTTEPVDTRVFVVNYSQASQIQGSIAPLVDTAAGGRIQVDKRSNALVITERPSRMNKIQEIIERLDRVTDQVMIESKFIEINKVNEKDIGVDWTSSLLDYDASVGDFASRVAGNGGDVVTESGSVEDILNGVTGPLTNNPLDTAVFSAQSFSVLLNALQSKSNTKLVSNPTVVTMDNEKAIIKISDEYPQPEYSFNAQTGARQFNGLGDPLDLGITLEVTPSVNAAGFINLDINPEVSAQNGLVNIEGTDFPIRAVRTARTRIMIKDGFTLALGGLVSERTDDGQTRVPFLGDIPGLGRLFRDDSKSTSSTNLIIFITAKTLNPDGTDYRDIVDPRVLDEMEIIPSMVPGYESSEEELKQINKLKDYREAANSAKTISEVNAEIEMIEAAKEAEAKKAALEAERAAREAEGTPRRSAGPDRM